MKKPEGEGNAVPSTGTQKDAGKAWTFPKAPEGRENQVFFTCQNYFYDYYDGLTSNAGLTFSIVSRRHVKPEDISVSLPIQSSYKVTVCEGNVSKTTEKFNVSEAENGIKTVYPRGGTNLDFYFYLYQTYRGMDWNALKEKKVELELLWQKREQTDISQEEKDALGKEYQSAAIAYREEELSYLDDYMKITDEELPEFYFYNVEISIDVENVTDEVLRNMKVQFGENSYDVEVGEIRLYSAEPNREYIEAMGTDSTGFVLTTGCPVDQDSYPYGPGIEACCTGSAVTKEDVTFTAGSLLKGTEHTTEILDIRVMMASDESFSDSMEMKWDGRTPLTIPAGNYFQIHLLVHDKRMQQLCYGGMVYFTLTYECEGKVLNVTEGISLIRNNYEPWFWYAAGLDNLNLEPYFSKYYFEERDIWRKEIDVS